jgi:hypothetical protein
MKYTIELHQLINKIEREHAPFPEAYQQVIDQIKEELTELYFANPNTEVATLEEHIADVAKTISNFLIEDGDDARPDLNETFSAIYWHIEKNKNSIVTEITTRNAANKESFSKAEDRIPYAKEYFQLIDFEKLNKLVEQITDLGALDNLNPEQLTKFLFILLDLEAYLTPLIAKATNGGIKIANLNNSSDLSADMYDALNKLVFQGTVAPGMLANYKLRNHFALRDSIIAVYSDYCTDVADEDYRYAIPATTKTTISNQLKSGVDYLTRIAGLNPDNEENSKDERALGMQIADVGEADAKDYKITIRQLIEKIAAPIVAEQLNKAKDSEDSDDAAQKSRIRAEKIRKAKVIISALTAVTVTTVALGGAIVVGTPIIATAVVGIIGLGAAAGWLVHKIKQNETKNALAKLVTTAVALVAIGGATVLGGPLVGAAFAAVIGFGVSMGLVLAKIEDKLNYQPAASQPEALESAVLPPEEPEPAVSEYPVPIKIKINYISGNKPGVVPVEAKPSNVALSLEEESEHLQQKWREQSERDERYEDNATDSMSSTSLSHVGRQIPSGSSSSSVASTSSARFKFGQDGSPSSHANDPIANTNGASSSTAFPIPSSGIR